MTAYESQVMESGAPPEEKRRASSRRACKKVLFVTNTNEYGGAEKHLLELIRRIRMPKLQATILCFDMDFFSQRLGSDDVDVINYKKAPQSLWDWAWLFRAVQPDLVVFVHSWFWAIPCGAVVGAWLAGVRKRFSIQHLMTPPILVSAQWLQALKKRRSMLRGILRKVLGRPEPPRMKDLPLCVMASMSGPAQLRKSAYFCTTTICVSNALRDTLVRDFGFPARKVKTIHNGVSVSEFVPCESRGAQVREKLGIGRDEFVLVCVARLSEQKGIDILLQSMTRVLCEGVRCKCIIVGDGPLKSELCEQARTIGLSGHVFFEGFQEDVRPYLQAGSAFILTSHREGLPLSILEAMACGLPIIATNVGGNAEAVSDQIHGLLVPPGSVEAVAEAITFLANHAEERAQMSKSARARVCDEFDIEVRMAEIKRLILS